MKAVGNDYDDGVPYPVAGGANGTGEAICDELEKPESSPSCWALTGPLLRLVRECCDPQPERPRHDHY